MKGLKKDRTEKEEKIRHPYTKITVVVQVLIIVLVALFLTLLFIIVNYSLKTKKKLYINSPLSLPQSFQLDNYVRAIDKLNMGTTYINIFIYTAVSVFMLAILCGITAQAIARCRHRFFRFCYIYFIIGILIPYQALFLPIYTIGSKMHLINTRFGIIFMYVATGISFGVFFMNSFMSTVPVELEETVGIGGCSVFKTYFSVMLSLLKPAMAALIIMQVFQIWNDYLLANLYVSKEQLKTLTVVIQSLFFAQTSDYTTAMAATVLPVLPIAVLFMCLQKYSIKGMTVGAVKG